MSAGDAQSLIEQALRLHRQGARAEARKLYQAAIAMSPDDAACNYYLGILLHEIADPVTAIRHLSRATRLRPDQAAWVSDLGAVCVAAGDARGAIDAFSKLVQLAPDRSDVWGQLGDLHRAAGDADRARECYSRALALAPAMSAASHNLALLLADGRELDAALAVVEAALGRAPDHGPLHVVRGIVLARRNEPHQARESFQRALELDGTLDEARLHLGLTLIELGESHAAQAALAAIAADSPFQPLALAGLADIASARGKHKAAIGLYEASLDRRPDQPSVLNNLGMALTRIGESAHAVTVLSRSLALAPDAADVLSNLGNAQLALGDTAAAEAALRQAIALAPEDARYAANLGNALWVAGRLAEAEAACRRAIELDPLQGVGWGNLGTVLRDQARFEEAVASYRRAVELEPASPAHLSNLLYALCYVSDITPEQLLAEHREYSRRFEAPLKAGIPPHANSKMADRKLRIGYVSADFKNHPVAHFLLPLLQEHDKAEFEIHAYSSTPVNDAITAQCRAQVDRWVECSGLDDDELAARIRRDDIDVLIDLSGHTAGNRLPALCRKPAPVQMTYLGYPATTGLDAIDYRITSRVNEGPSAEKGYAERLVCLTHGHYAMKPASDWPRARPAPCVTKGHVTFGSFNNANKLGDECLGVWQRIMARVPSSRLVLLAVPDETARQRILRVLNQAGIGAERVRFEGRLPRRKFMDAMLDVDISLDSFPMNGGTTTIEAICMGIPVVAMLGRRYVSRASAGILASGGLDRFIAADKEAYVELAANLAADPAGIARLREELRGVAMTSPVTDVQGLARRIEAAYREAWKAWCAGGAVVAPGD
ncbi:MAG: tetratricopeptide repeat protein [Betaproteobacteria bacterium]|nr:tetratricopeptide repeat protein [Betaproteobacteria bacterium]